MVVLSGDERAGWSHPCGRQAMLLQKSAAVFANEAEQQVLGSDVVMAEQASFFLRTPQCLSERAGCSRPLPMRARSTLVPDTDPIDVRFAKCIRPQHVTLPSSRKPQL